MHLKCAQLQFPDIYQVFNGQDTDRALADNITDKLIPKAGRHLRSYIQTVVCERTPETPKSRPTTPKLQSLKTPKTQPRGSAIKIDKHIAQRIGVSARELRDCARRHASQKSRAAKTLAANNPPNQTVKHKRDEDEEDMYVLFFERMQSP